MDATRLVPGRAAYVLSWVSAAAAIAASAGGLLIVGVYRDGTDWAIAALRGGDVATLGVAVPALVVALILATRGSVRAVPVWAGLLAYGVYNSAFYAFGAVFNDLFLSYVLAMSSSLFALATLLGRLDLDRFALHVAERAPRRIVGALLIGTGVVFGSLWTTFALTYAITGSLNLGAAPLEGIKIVFALDLGLMVPSMIVSGVLLWRGSALGRVLGIGMCVFGAVYQVNLALAGAFQHAAGVEGVKAVDPMSIAFFVAFLAGAIGLLRSVRPNAVESDRR